MAAEIVASITQGARILGALSGLLNQTDTMKQQTSCGMTLNSGQSERLSKLDMPPLTTQWRTSVKRKVSGRTTSGRTWQECVKARTAYPKQVNGPISGADMFDYMPGVADENGMLAQVVQVQASPYVAAQAIAAGAPSAPASLKTIAAGASSGQAIADYMPWIVGAVVVMGAVWALKG